MIIYKAKGIEKEYHSGEKSLTILQSIDLELKAGEMTAIVGASGSGKTTLLQILGTLASPTAGELWYDNANLCLKSEKQLAGFRNSTLGFIFQAHHLLPEFTALENVMIPAMIGGKKQTTIQAAAEKLLDKVELGHRKDHKVNELSGGEQQRAALARALIMQPKILLADEPTGNLDSRAGEIVFSLLQELSKSLGLTIVMVTHNMELAKRMHSCYTLKDGTLLR